MALLRLQVKRLLLAQKVEQEKLQLLQLKEQVLRLEMALAPQQIQLRPPVPRPAEPTQEPTHQQLVEAISQATLPVEPMPEPTEADLLLGLHPRPS